MSRTYRAWYERITGRGSEWQEGPALPGLPALLRAVERDCSEDGVGVADIEWEASSVDAVDATEALRGRGTLLLLGYIEDDSVVAVTVTEE